MFIIAATWAGCGRLSDAPSDSSSEAPGVFQTADAPGVIRTDGRFEEWRRSTAVIDDPVDADPDSAVDLGPMHVLDDPSRIHFALNLGRPVNAQSMGGSLEILLDADGSAETGHTVEGLSGVDMVIVLSRQDHARPDGYGAGNGIRAVTSLGPSSQIRHGDTAQLLTSPTHSSDRIEVRLRRGLIFDDLPPLAAGREIGLKVVFRDALGLRDETAAARYRLRSQVRLDAPLPSASLESKPEGTFRVLQWNVAANFMRRNPVAFQRIFKALSPDVVLLDEVLRDSSQEELLSLFQDLAKPETERWQVVQAVGGGRQKTVVASRFPLRSEPRLQPVEYPLGALDRLGRQVNQESFSQVLDVEKQAGLATVGVWAEILGRRILFAPLDLQSGGYDGSSEDRLRELQASTLARRLGQVMGGEAATVGLIVAGDFNLVGSRTPLDILRRESDLSSRALEAVPAYRLGDESQATWRSLSPGAFTPGRLDFILYSPSRLELVQSFVFDSGGLSSAQLVDSGLQSQDSQTASRHLPTVADFRWK